jgi:hypothetical protein
MIFNQRGLGWAFCNERKLMSACAAVTAGARTATAGCAAGRRAASVVGMDQGQFAFNLLTAALLALDLRILLAHGTDGFELFLAR